MKKLLLTYFICFSGIVGNARTTDVEVSYRYSHPEQTMKSADADITNQYILITNGEESKFYSPKTEYIDSIESTPEGFEWFNTFKRVCYEKKQKDLIPRVDGSFYVTKSFKDKKVKTYDVAAATRYKWEEPLAEIDWNITDSTKNIFGYESFMASADFHGRKWTVWFSPEIPVKDGPWKLHGLPGIILEAACETGQYYFIADGIQQTVKPFYDIYSEHNWEPTNSADFWNLRRVCLENPSRNMSASDNIIIFQGIRYNKYLPREVVDYIETDYK